MRILMNWPNRLSIIRILSVPLLTVLLYASAPWCGWAALIVFVLACMTDFLDGHLARKNNWVTDFGKFIDPVADKLLVLSALIMLIHLQLIPAWLVILILARELSVDGLRLVAMTRGKVIAAGPLGKIKTASQMIVISILLCFRTPLLSSWFGICMAVWVSGITLYSGIDYFRKNASILK